MITWNDVPNDCVAPISCSQIKAALAFTIFIATSCIAIGNEVSKNESALPPICGRVRTEANDVVVLREGTALSPLEFTKVRYRKMKGAEFLPDVNLNCAIQVCGFNSYGDQYDPGYIGTTSDYADCGYYSENSTAPEFYFNSKYNTSSITCGCNKREADCTYTCPDRALNLKDRWTDNDCAVLFRETRCNSCYLNPIPLSKGQNYSTDNTVQVRTLVVRDSCIVKQYSPTFHRMWRLRNLSQPLEYLEGPTENNVVSNFQGEPEFFHCECNVNQTPTTPPSTSSTNKPEQTVVGADTSKTIIVITVGGVVLVLVLCVGGFIWWRNRRAGTEDSKKRPSTETNSTKKFSIESSYYNSSYYNDERTSDNNGLFNILVDHTSFYTCREDFDIESPLDEGHFGEVCSGTLRVAIKKVRADPGPEEERELALKSLQQEMNILAHLGTHKNVVRLLGVHIGDIKNCELFLIMELCQCSLKSYIKSVVRPRINEKKSALAMNKSFGIVDSGGYPVDPCRFEYYMEGRECSSEVDLEQLDLEMLFQFYQWIQQIVCGMQYIQSKRIIHVDLATRNVLLTRNLTAKIGDFGLSKKMYVSNYVDSRKDSFPIRWVAPESLINNRFSPKSDVWSFGITVWEIFSLGDDPYEGKHGFEVVKFITIQKERLESPHLAPTDVYAKMRQCWEEDPAKRPSFDDLELYFEEKCREFMDTT